MTLLVFLPSIIFANWGNDDENFPEGNTTYDELVKVIGTGEERNYGYWYVNESLNASGRDKGVLPKGFNLRTTCDNFLNEAGNGQGGFILVPSETEDKFEYLLKCGEDVRASVNNSTTLVYYQYIHHFIMNRTTGNWYIYDIDNTKLPEILGETYRHAQLQQM